MGRKRVVVLLVVALAAYFALIGYRAFSLLGQDSVVLKILGAAVLVIPLIGAWLVVAELRFGRLTERLARRLDDEGEPPEPDLPRRPSGRVDPAAAETLFEQRRADVEESPDDWRCWYRLALAYDYAGDRGRARAAMRVAITKSA